MNGNALLTYVEWVLVPILAPSDLVIMDNLSAHKVSGVKEVIEVPGACSYCFTHPTSMRSSKPSLSLKPCLERPVNEQSMTNGQSSPRRSNSSLR